MKGYWIVKVNVLDIEKQKEYASNAGKAVKKYEGKFLVRGGEQLIKEGKNKVLHGPLDWGHLNHEGYKLVSEFINIQIN